MPEPVQTPKTGLSGRNENMIREVEVRAARIERRRGWHARGVWHAIATVGIIGWTVVLPMLAGIAVGGWIDRRWPSRYSWTLMLMVGGLILGCVTAWHRIRDEQEDR